MMLLVPVAIGVAGLGAWVYHSRTTPHGKIEQALDKHLPAKLRTAVAYSITQSKDPKALVTLAKKLEPTAPVAAAMVATRAKQIVKAAPPKPTLVKPLPRTPADIDLTAAYSPMNDDGSHLQDS